MQAFRIGVVIVALAIAAGQGVTIKASPQSPVRQASGGSQNAQAGVRQVAGQEGSSRGRGLLGSIFGGRNTSANQSNTSPHASSPGLLSRLGGGKSDDDGRRVIEPAPQTVEPDWSGVPFHNAKPALAAQNNRPITDPNDPSNKGKTIPKPSGSTTGASTTYANSSTVPRSEPSASPRPQNSRIPVPPAENMATERNVPSSRPGVGATARTQTATSPVMVNEVDTSTFEPLSATESSRRSRRKTVSPLAGEEFAYQSPARGSSQTTPVQIPTTPLAETAPAPAPQPSQVAGSPARELPRVNRRPLPGGAGATAEPTALPNASVPPSLAAQSSRRGMATNMPTTLQRKESDIPSPRAAAGNGSSDQTDATIAAAPTAAPSATTPTSTENTNAAASPTASAVTAPAASSFAATTPAETGTESKPWRAPVDQPTAAAPAATAPAAGEPIASDAIAGPWQTAIPSLRENNAAVEAAATNRLNAPAAGTNVAAAPQNQPIGAASAPPTATAPLGVQAREPSGNTPIADAGNAVAVNAKANNVAGEIPGLRVVTSGPAEIPVRQAITYTVSIENLGAIDAPGAMVQIELPVWVTLDGHQPTRGEVGREDDAAARHLLWMVQGLPGGSREEITLTLTATEAKAFEVSTEWAIIPQSSSARVAVREPKLEIYIEGPDTIVYGESETYKVRVVNPGSGVAESVLFTLSPNSATPQSQRIGSLDPGKEAQFEVELTAREMEDLQIHGLAGAAMNLKAEKIKSLQVVRAELEAVLTGPAVKYQDSEASYNLQLTNLGKADCRQIQAILELPPGVVYLGGIEGATVTGNRIGWSIDNLAPDQTIDLTLMCQMKQTGQQNFGFACQGSAAGRTEVSLVTQVDALADLVLSINDPAAPAPVGKEVMYEIIVRNRGSKAAENVVVLAQFGEDIEPIRIEGAQGDIVPGQVKFAAIPRIDAGQQVAIKVFAKAERAGHHRFAAEVSCGDTLLIAEEATRYLELVGQRVSRRSGEELK
jgi:hypothetical protein